MGFIENYRNAQLQMILIIITIILIDIFCISFGSLINNITANKTHNHIVAKRKREKGNAWRVRRIVRKVDEKKREVNRNKRSLGGFFSRAFQLLRVRRRFFCVRTSYSPRLLTVCAS